MLTKEVSRIGAGRVGPELQHPARNMFRSGYSALIDEFLNLPQVKQQQLFIFHKLAFYVFYFQVLDGLGDFSHMLKHVSYGHINTPVLAAAGQLGADIVA